MLALAALALAMPAKPKLVLLISIDQFRADYVTRFASQYLPAKSGGKLGGFRFLSETGAYYTDAHHNHVPTATGPGHATLMTGSEPYLDGIADNDWYSRDLKKSVYCVSDPTVKTIGGVSDPMSPKNLWVTTVGDELKMATNNKSKVVGVAFKDRASILMSGHAADTVIWFDQTSGNWVTSSFYANALPGWVQSLNNEKIPAQSAGKSWEPMLPLASYGNARIAPFAKADANGTFSHKLPAIEAGKKNVYSSFTASSFGQEYVFTTVKRAIEGEHLGKGPESDVLVVNLSTNDYVGHAFGPNSPEVMDMALRTDRLLSDLFNTIDQQIGIDNVDIVVTADHGVVPIPEESDKAFRTGVKRVSEANVAKAAQAELVAKFGEGKWIEGSGEMYLYLNHDLIAEHKLSEEEVQMVAAHGALKATGVAFAFTRDQILEGALPKWEFVERIYNGYNRRLGGDVMFFFEPGDYVGGGVGTGHGTPWKYDTHVPLLLRGPGITRGHYARGVATADIAPTLSTILGIEYPSGCVGHPLFEALSSGNNK